MTQLQLQLGTGADDRVGGGQMSYIHRNCSVLFCSEKRTSGSACTAAVAEHVGRPIVRSARHTWYGMVNVDLYSAIITKVSNALDTLASGEKPGFQTLSEGLVVLLCAEVVHVFRSHCP